MQHSTATSGGTSGGAVSAHSWDALEPSASSPGCSHRGRGIVTTATLNHNGAPQTVTVKVMNLAKVARFASLVIEHEAALLSNVALRSKDTILALAFGGIVRGPLTPSWKARFQNLHTHDDEDDDSEEVVGLVTKFEAGPTLAERLTPTGVPWEADTATRLKLLIGVADALLLLHSAGIAHGSLSTENVLLHADSEPRLCDIGNADNNSSDVVAFGTLAWAVLASNPAEHVVDWDLVREDVPAKLVDALALCFESGAAPPSMKTVLDALVDAHKERASTEFAVFLSHAWSGASHAPVTHLCHTLLRKNAQAKTWYDSHEIEKDIDAEMLRGVANSKIFVALVSEKYATRPRCIREMQEAKALGKPLIIINVDANDSSPLTPSKWWPNSSTAEQKALNDLVGSSALLLDFRETSRVMANALSDFMATLPADLPSRDFEQRKRSLAISKAWYTPRNLPEENLNAMVPTSIDLIRRVKTGLNRSATAKAELVIPTDPAKTAAALASVASNGRDAPALHSLLARNLYNAEVCEAAGRAVLALASISDEQRARCLELVPTLIKGLKTHLLLRSAAVAQSLSLALRAIAVPAGALSDLQTGQRLTQFIVGTLDLCGAKKYGFSTQNVPSHLFTPVNKSSFPQTYPLMKVGKRLPANFTPSNKSEWRNIYALATVRAGDAPAVAELTPGEFHDTPADKKKNEPAREGLGFVGDTDAEMRALEWYACPQAKWPSSGDKKGGWVKSAVDFAKRVNAQNEGATMDVTALGARVDLDWAVTFNIDNATTKDIDDVVSIRQSAGSDDVWEFAVTIADVASVLPVASDVDEAACVNGETLYSDEGSALRSMLPPELSEDVSSLLPNEWRLGVAMFFTWTEPDVHDDLDPNQLGRLGQPRFEAVRIRNKRFFSYDNVIAESTALEWGNEIYALKAAINALQNAMKIGRDRDLSASPHTWIEALMLFYNMNVGTELRKRATGILRYHDAPDKERLASLIKIKKRLLKTRLPAAAGARNDPIELIEFFAYSSAKYCSAQREDTSHWALNAQAYAHASSPIRRYADLENQRALLGLPRRAVGSAAEATLCDALNATARRRKVFRQEAFFLKKVDLNALITARAIFIALEENAEAAEDDPEEGGEQMQDAEGGERLPGAQSWATPRFGAAASAPGAGGDVVTRASFWIPELIWWIALKVDVVENVKGGERVVIKSRDGTSPNVTLVRGEPVEIVGCADLRKPGGWRRVLKFAIKNCAAATAAGNGGSSAGADWQRVAEIPGRIEAVAFAAMHGDGAAEHAEDDPANANASGGDEQPTGSE
jgi:serine/threonine protein kinase